MTAETREAKSMSTIDLIILGILQTKSMNAYELTQFIESRDVNRLVKISNPSIYKCCKKLHAGGYLSAKIIREGENPEKTVYSVTPGGKSHFYKLMQYFSGNIQPFYFDFNSFIWNLDRVEPAKGLAMLTNLQSQINSLNHWINNHEREVASAPFSVRMIVRQYRMTINSMDHWIKSVVQDYRKEKKIR